MSFFYSLFIFLPKQFNIFCNQNTLLRYVNANWRSHVYLRQCSKKLNMMFGCALLFSHILYLYLNLIFLHRFILFCSGTLALGQFQPTSIQCMKHMKLMKHIKPARNSMFHGNETHAVKWKTIKLHAERESNPGFHFHCPWVNCIFLFFLS